MNNEQSKMMERIENIYNLIKTKNGITKKELEGYAMINYGVSTRKLNEYLNALKICGRIDIKGDLILPL